MWQLQNIEVEMVKLRKEWMQIKELLNRDTGEDLAVIQSGISEAREQWGLCKEEYEESVSEIATIGRKLDQFNSQLYEGGAQSKELVSIQQNIDQLLRRKHNLEDKQLSSIEKLDDLEKKIANETVRFQRLEEQRKSRLNRLDKRRDEVREQYQTLKDTREGLRAIIPADMMAIYNDLVTQKKRPLAILVDKENCSGCGIAQTVLNVNALKKRGQYTRCSNCGRILITSDEAEQE
jgi:predicted  nucleic acid-binding Zn-ribbon protein